jgi:hypothetical protein
MAQDASAPKAQAEPTTAQAAPATTAKDASPAKTEEAPDASTQWLSGTVDAGVRWTGDVHGNQAAYRSVVNLGQGIKLFGLDLTMRDPSRRLFDKLTVRADSWGGEPYSTMRLDVERERTYRLSVNYRDLTYFNALPSFADPTLSRGVILDQQSFDTRRRMFDSELVLFPTKRIVPFFGYSRDWGSGAGVTDFTSDLNEYPVPTTFRDRTSTYRGGVRFEYDRFHLTLEEGGSVFGDNQQVFSSGTNLGNLTSLFLGQRLSLTGLDQRYDITGDNVYSKILFTANPYPWIDLYGQALYSRPRTETGYFQDNTGNFFNLDQFLFYGSGQRGVSSTARMPHTSASFGAELRPHRRFRILESVTADRFHVPASFLADNTDLRLSPGTPAIASSTDVAGVEPFHYSYNAQEVNVLFDASSKLTLRGGHRYVWGDALTRAPGLSQTGPVESGETRMHVGLAGLTFRPVQKASLGFDFEAASADRNYFRTSLQDYQKLRARARYQVLQSLSLGANFSLLNNLNPSVQNRYEFRSREDSLSVYWTPWGGKWISLLGDYTYSTLKSNISYLIPQTVTLTPSLYRETARIATGMLEVNLPKYQKVSPKLSLGGSLFSSSGSRPTQYYQPTAKVSLPVTRKVQWMLEWRWYSLGETLYMYEGFRTHIFSTGLRLAL